MKDLEDYLSDNNITYFDWNIVSGDASGHILSADTICANCVSKLDQYHEAVILMHDAAEKHTTVEALPRIIETIQGMEDTVILPISDDTFPIQHRN
jgi:peptidoglycan/xylan/chitin deacetylase (PgdA/CDA1 family)